MNAIMIGDCRESLKFAADQGVEVQMCVTSPPYFGLRDYGHAGQIGLEQTPDEYVAKMVEVFREVRRVLRDDGTLWLNLGDSYANPGHYKGNPGSGLNSHAQAEKANGHKHDKSWPGAKNKDLIGIPWRVAFALQQPYYAGRIKRELDRVWLAAMVDGEGCFYVHRRPAGQHAGGGYFRTQDSYSPAFEVANTHKAIIDRCIDIAGCGSVICQEKDRRQPLWRWTVRAQEAREIAREIYPYLVGKQQQCRIICGMPSSGDKAEAAWQAMKLLHGGKDSTVDFSTPESLHQPGYYLRQDLIWSKPNPMPESVRDRCTKAHEYIFLLSKSERYYFDSEAIKEPAVQPRGEPKLTGQHKADAGGFTTNGKGNSTLGTNQGAETRNRRSVWTVTTKPYKGAHFATFPPDLIEPCVLAGSRPGDIVLDPFMGSGTTAAVALKHGRQYFGCELNPEYTPLQDARIAQA